MRKITVLITALALFTSSVFLRPLGAETLRYGREEARETSLQGTFAGEEAEHDGEDRGGLSEDPRKEGAEELQDAPEERAEEPEDKDGSNDLETAAKPEDSEDKDGQDGSGTASEPEDNEAGTKPEDAETAVGLEGTEAETKPEGSETATEPEGSETAAEQGDSGTAAADADQTKEDTGDAEQKSEEDDGENGLGGTEEEPGDLEEPGADADEESSLPGFGTDGSETVAVTEEPAEESTEPKEAEESEAPKKAAGDTRAAVYRVTVRIRANGGSIDTPAEDANTVYPIYRVLASTDRVQIKRSKTAGWANYSEVVTTDETYHNLINVGEMGLYRTGYHVISGRAYNTKADASGLRISQVNSASSSTNPATAVRINGGEPVTEDKTVDIYVEWIEDSCTIVLHSNGGSWYRPAQGEPAGALGTPSGSGTDRTFTKTLKYQDTAVLHNTFEELLTDYYIINDYAEDDFVIPEGTESRWITWFRRDGYVFQGWNTQPDINGAATSRYPGRNVLDGGKMLDTQGTLISSAVNNFGESCKLNMSKLGAANGDTVHLYAQWRKQVTAGAGELSSGVRLSAEGFSSSSPLYDGLELMIPNLANDTAEKLQAGGSEDFVWQVKNGIGHFWLQSPLTKNVPYDSGSTLWVLFPDRAYDIHGVTYDVKVTLTDIRLLASRDVDAGSPNIFRVDMANGEVQCSAYPSQTGASYTVTIQIFESGTDREVTGMRSMVLLRDMDIPDRIGGAARYQYRWNDGASPAGTYTTANGRVPAIYPYAEAVKIPASSIAAPYTRAAGKVLYMQQDNSLVFAETADGIHVTGSEYTGSQSSELGQVLQRDSYKTGVAFPTVTGSTEFVWTGNSCGTTLFEDGELNRITSEVVEEDGVTPVNGGTGDPEEGGTITFGGLGPRAYPFNSSTVYSVTPAENYKVTRVWLDMGTDHMTELIVDGEEHTVSGGGTYRISEEGGSFTFVGIVADHDIRVSFVRSWPRAGSLSVEKIVAGSMGSRDKAFHFTVKMTHELGYENYPEEGITVRLNDGEEQVMTPAFDLEEPGCAVLQLTLTHGDVVTLSGLWEDTVYTVTEEEADRNGYATAYENGSGVIAADQTAAVRVTNARDLAVPTGASMPMGLPILAAGLAGVTGVLAGRKGRKSGT